MFNRFIQPLRIAVAWSFLLFQLYLGVQFYRFVLYSPFRRCSPIRSTPRRNRGVPSHIGPGESQGLAAAAAPSTRSIRRGSSFS